jgi:hypothetical protein
MDPTRVKPLVDEAEALAIYATRVGKFPEDSRIFEVIDSMRQVLRQGECPEISPLIVETLKVSSAAGLTMEQLAHRETPLNRFRQWAARTTPFLIGFMTLLLTLYLAFQSSQLHKADLALRENQDLVGERLQEKIYLAWKMYKYESVLNVRGPPMAQLDSYQKLVDDAKRLSVKRMAVQFLLIESSVIRYVPEWLEYVGPYWLQNLFRRLNDSGTGTSLARNAAPSPSDSSAAVVAKEGELKEAMAKEIDCLKLHAPQAKKGKPLTVESKIDLDEYVHSFACFMQSLEIVEDDYPTDPLIYATRNKVHLLVSWLLPGLYGLLGACVFVMRDLLRDNGSSKAGGDVRIVDLLTLLLRVALGGLAGIIIGWFSVPTSQNTSSAAISISSISFGMAFLAGFSIETLFTLLDRFNKTIGEHDKKKL